MPASAGVGARAGNVKVRFKVKLKMNFRPLLSKAWKAKQRNLRRAGAIVRGIMRRLIRPRKNPRLASPVGTPPYAHFYPGLKNTIEFAVYKDKMIVGPQLTTRNISPVPGALEYGGQTLVRAFRPKSKKKRKRKKGKYVPHVSKNGKPVPTWWKKKNPMPPKGAKVRAKIRPRPFARPAMSIFTNSPRYAEIWRNCIK